MPSSSVTDLKLTHLNQSHNMPTVSQLKEFFMHDDVWFALTELVNPHEYVTHPESLPASKRHMYAVNFINRNLAGIQ